MTTARAALLLTLSCLAGCKGAPGTTGQSGPAGSPASFAGPGLQLGITSAQVAADGTTTVTLRVTDDAGTPLDLAGLDTEGAVSIQLSLAWLDESAPGAPLGYTAFTVAGGAPSADAGGTFTSTVDGTGTYLYTFAAKALPAQPTRTHTVVAWGARTYRGARAVAAVSHDFVPSGAAVVTRREVVLKGGCDACHRDLSAHGGAQRSIAGCQVCHTAQAVDDAGAPLELGALVHRIHAGASLPSVVAGGACAVVTGGVVHDFSDVVFPQDLRRCTSCHDGAQADLWKTRPSRAGCGACHDTTSYDASVPAGMVAHSGGPVTGDGAAACSGCHPASGGAAGVSDLHLDALAVATTVALTIQAVDPTPPGATLAVTFRVAVNGAPRDIVSSPLSTLTATVAGPTTDYATSWQSRAQGPGATGTLVAVDAPNGVFQYLLPAPMPVSATGTYAVALEGYLTGAGARYAASSAPWYFAVTDAVAVPRRMVVLDAKCDACHAGLAEHGGVRTGVQYCLLCHNPATADSAATARFEVPTVVAPTLNLKDFVHRLHRGQALVQPYVLGGFPLPTPSNPAGTPIDYGAVRFPGDLRDCTTCHLAGTFDLPGAAGALPSHAETLTCTDGTLNPTSYCATRTAAADDTPPQTAACTSCHDAPWTAAHAAVMTTSDGVESCATCHRAGAAFGVDVVHQIP